MSFEVRATDIGPIIVYNDEFIALTSEDAMITVCYEDAERFNVIRDHIIDELRDAFDLYMEGFTVGLNPPAGKLYAYVAALQQYWIFKNIKYAQYLAAFAEAEEE